MVRGCRTVSRAAKRCAASRPGPGRGSGASWRASSVPAASCSSSSALARVSGSSHPARRRQAPSSSRVSPGWTATPPARSIASCGVIRGVTVPSTRRSRQGRPSSSPTPSTCARPSFCQTRLQRGGMRSRPGTAPAASGLPRRFSGSSRCIASTSSSTRSPGDAAREGAATCQGPCRRARRSSAGPVSTSAGGPGGGRAMSSGATRGMAGSASKDRRRRRPPSGPGGSGSSRGASAGRIARASTSCAAASSAMARMAESSSPRPKRGPRLATSAAGNSRSRRSSRPRPMAASRSGRGISRMATWRRPRTGSAWTRTREGVMRPCCPRAGGAPMLASPHEGLPPGPPRPNPPPAGGNRERLAGRAGRDGGGDLRRGTPCRGRCALT